MSMIGFMMGTAIAFFVVIGDLAPPIIANLAGIVATEKLRFWLLVGIGVLVVIPLSLLRNIDSLLALCTISIMFYSGVMLYVVFTSRFNLWLGNWTSSVTWWRPAGIFQCLPIFCMALSCQPQVFEIYEALQDPSVSTMNEIVRGAVNLCTGIYLSMGVFGYIAFYNLDFGGNILTSYQPSVFTEAIKIGFTLSVAMSFPLVIFPCRTSIHSLIFRRVSIEMFYKNL